MTTFTGTENVDTADASIGFVSGFTGGGGAELQDNQDDIFFCNGGHDIVVAGGSNDILAGGAGNDQLNGGGGNDTLIGDGQFGGLVGNDILTGGNGIDEAVYTSTQAGVTVNLALTVAQNTGGAGIDTLSGIENLFGGSFNDILTGDINDNMIFGDAGDDLISGGAGNDLLEGGDGNDTYVLANGTDTVIDTGGIDTITSTISRSLATYPAIENLTLLGAAAINGTGTGLNNTITGNGAANILDGGLGLDTLIGGLGNDTFVLANATDTVNDTGGIDTITSTITRSLAAYPAIENLTLVGASSINGTGNGLNNVITGNIAANILNGSSGNDTLNGVLGPDSLIGGLGNDTFVLGNEQDTVNDTGGIDTITSTITRSLATYPAVENLTLLGAAAINGTGNNLNNVITGNAAANILNGGAGNDTLSSGFGNDTLIGGLGKDTLTGSGNGDRFDFNALTESVVGANRDVIADFNRAQGDKIDLSTIDADTDGTAGNQAFSFLGAGAFTGVDGQLRCAAGIIQGDVNGDKVADFEIKVNLATMIGSDFIL